MIIKREKKIKLDPYERTIEEFTYMDVDLTVVEILPEDEILNEFFLRPSIYYRYNFEKLDFEKITIIQYPNGILNYSYGKIENIDHYTFSNSASTDIGSSGGPIINSLNDKVIILHRGYIKEKYNIGTFLKFPLNELNKNLNKKNGGSFFIAEIHSCSCLKQRFACFKDRQTISSKVHPFELS